MKRSVMEKKIASVLNNLQDVKMSNFLKAKIVLDVVEESGMMPPERNYTLLESIDGRLEECFVSEYQWEKE